MELEIEIPIWFHGKVKWVSNLTSRSTCSDIIKAILSFSSINSNDILNLNENYYLSECRHGIERPLKNHCRILKLWKSWTNESKNVILTIRSHDDVIFPSYLIINQQENKLKKLKRQIKKFDKQIEKINLLNKLNNKENENNLFNYLNLTNSILNLNNQIDNQKNIIFNLKNQIENQNENQNENEHFFENNFKNLLHDINQTLITSRKLTQLSDDLDQEINQINDHIEKKQLLLDDLELDYALQDNIDLDSLDEQFYQSNSFNQISSTQFMQSPIKTFSAQNRPTAIVEPNLSTLKTKEGLLKNRLCSLSINNINLQEKSIENPNINILSDFKKSSNQQFKLFYKNQSDISTISIHSNDQQLITLV